MLLSVVKVRRNRDWQSASKLQYI